MDNYVIFTKCSSQKVNGNNFSKKSFLEPNSYCKQPFTNHSLAVWLTQNSQNPLKQLFFLKKLPLVLFHFLFSLCNFYSIQPLVVNENLKFHTYMEFYGVELCKSKMFKFQIWNIQILDFFILENFTLWPKFWRKFITILSEKIVGPSQIVTKHVTTSVKICCTTKPRNLPHCDKQLFRQNVRQNVH